MTSQRQQRREMYDHILPFITEAADDFYGGNPDRGFRHWSFATIFGVGHDIGDNDIIDYTAIDGSDDFEIDGYFMPESDDDSVVHLFQSKHRQPDTGMGQQELSKFLLCPERILNEDQVAASHNEETKALHDRLMEKLRDPAVSCTINLVWATSGYLRPAARTLAAEKSSTVLTTMVDGNPREIAISLECWDLTDIYSHLKTQQESDDLTTKCDVNFQLEEGTFHEVGAEYRTLSMTIPVKQVIDVFARHSYKIFRLNPRGPLGNKVNRTIKSTLLDETERKRFHLLNNGITAICDSWRLDGSDLFVQDFQIINGCQTTVTLWDARAVVQGDPGVLITIKLTECPSHFAPTIAKATNSQTALRAEDFTSNEEVQIRLQRQFLNMSPPWFYQIKRGEWSKMMSRSDREAFRDSEGSFRQLNSKDVAQAVVAFAGFPGEAKDKIRDFLNKDDVSSIARESEFNYNQIYTSGASAIQFLLPAIIQSKVKKQVNLDKSQEPWMDYARFHIVWLIGDILRTHYSLSGGHLFTENRAATLIAHVDDWFSAIYNIAVVAIRNARQETENRGQFSGYREFFRSASNYRTIESNVRGALQLASSLVANPLSDLPA